ncbi:peptide deformylase [Paludisphaera mucosa]|uniref:Peptide deformylase n=1 Tax=Paludisphaera mucosa TaxID=3030827 RepID=A0ABT6FKZ5_9BACT|nr:peptide deformylase [Paludisphaera mucosa]MDG3008065.1 peptide deformylase [Paludisphaera mucosa]
MAVLRQIAQLGHPALRTPAEAVAFPLSDEVRTLVDDMLATMREADGVGIAAPQVYRSLRIFIVAPRPNPRYPDAIEETPIVAINPEIVERSDEREKGWEGCLSIPGIRAEVPRNRWIVVRYQDLQGDHIVRKLEDFVARIFQHEDDHLHGLVFLDRLDSPRDVITEREHRRRLAEG